MVRLSCSIQQIGEAKDKHFFFVVWNVYKWEEVKNTKHYPTYSIKYHGFYLAHLGFAHAAGNKGLHKELIDLRQVYTLDMSDNKKDKHFLYKE